MAEANAGGEALLGLARPELEEKKREGKTDEAPRADKDDAARRARFVDGRRVESPARRRSRYRRRVAGRGMGGGMSTVTHSQQF